MAIRRSFQFEHFRSSESAGVTAVVAYDGIPVGGFVDWDDQKIEACFFVAGPEGDAGDGERRLALDDVDPIVVSEVCNDLAVLAEKVRA